MDKDHEAKPIGSEVLKKIMSGDVKAHSRGYFVLKNALIVLAIGIVSLILLFVMSFLFFALHASGLWYLPALGLKGIELLVSNFPWLLILCIAVFIIVLELLVRRYGFAYRVPLLYSVMAILLAVLAMSFLVDRTSLHDAIYRRIESGGLPAAKPLYDGYTKPNAEDFHPGTVVDIRPDGLVLENADRSRIHVMITDQTRISPGLKIEVGAKLLVIGRVQGGAIQAEAIGQAPPGGRP